MKILALITARGGSKRLPGKNVRVLGGKPLIVWSVDVAKGIPEICDILVSTDDPAIAAIAAAAGAYVPWLRPEGLATDTATSIDVALHALNWYEAEKGPVNGLLLLQPTSPFRTKETVRKGIALFKTNGQHSVLGVSLSPAHPMWTFKIEGNSLAPFMEGNGLQTRSQDLPEAFVVNGCLYLSSPMNLRHNQSFIDSNTSPLLIDTYKEAIDIDTEWDWYLAEFCLKKPQY